MPALVLGMVIGWFVGVRNLDTQVELAKSSMRYSLERRFATERTMLEARAAVDADRLVLAEASIEALRLQLDREVQRSVTEAQELGLYRRLEAGKLPFGLNVEQVQLLEGEPRQLDITLLQSQGRERVQGRLGLELLIARDETASAERVALTLLSPDDEKAVRFDMRFFQTLRLTLPEVTIPESAILKILIQPDKDTLEPSIHQVPWQQLLNEAQSLESKDLPHAIAADTFEY